MSSLSQTPRTNIVALINSAYASAKRVCSGVLRYAAAHPEIDVRICGIHPSNNDFAYALDWKTDGIISTFSPKLTYAQKFIRLNRGCPVVFCGGIDTTEMTDPFAAVLCDNENIAHEAAKLLLHHKLKNLAYFGARQNEPWDIERQVAFTNYTRSHGGTIHVYQAKPRDIKSIGEYDALATWLKSLPKPCGIFASHDQRAVHILNVCRQEKIAVPEQIQVLSVDNEEWLCEQTVPTLSSIELDFEGGGFAAADTLYRMIHKQRFSKISAFGALSVVERMSTTDQHGHLSSALRARDYIRTHATERLTVSEISLKVNIPVRTLQASYQKVFSRTLMADIIETRLEKVRVLLRTTTLSIDKITQLTGFGSPLHLMRLFKRTTGMTMLAYRREQH